MKKLLMGLIRVPSEYKTDEDVYKAFEQNKKDLDGLWLVLQRYATKDAVLLGDSLLGSALTVTSNSIVVNDAKQLLNLAEAFGAGRDTLGIKADKGARAACLALYCYYQAKQNSNESVLMCLIGIEGYASYKFNWGELRDLLKARKKSIINATKSSSSSSSSPADSKSNNAAPSLSVPTTPRNPTTGNTTPPTPSSSSAVTSNPTVSTAPSSQLSTHLSMLPPSTSVAVPSIQPTTSSSSPAPTAPAVNQDKKEDDDSPLGFNIHAGQDEDALKIKEKEKEVEKPKVTTATAAPSASTNKPPVSATANPLSTSPFVSTTTTAAPSAASSSSTSATSAANTKSKKAADDLMETTLDQLLINLVKKGFTYSGVELHKLLSRYGVASGLGRIISDFENGKYKDDKKIGEAFEIKSFNVQGTLVKNLVIKRIDHLFNLALLVKSGDKARNIKVNNEEYAICLGLVCDAQDKQLGVVSIGALDMMYNSVSSPSVKEAIKVRIEQRRQEIAAAQKPAETKDNDKSLQVQSGSSSSSSPNASLPKQQPSDSSSTASGGQSSPPPVAPLPVAPAVVRPLKTANYQWLYFKQEVRSFFKYGWGVLKAAWACIRNRSTADFEQRMEALRMKIASEAVLVKIQMKPDEFSALRAFSRAMANRPKLENEIAIKPPMLVQPGKRPQDELTLIVDVARAARIRFFSDKKASNPTTPLTDAEIARLRALKEDSVKLAVKLK